MTTSAPERWCTPCTRWMRAWLHHVGSRPAFYTFYRKTTLVAKTPFSKVYDCVPVRGVIAEANTDTDRHPQVELVVKIQNPLANSNRVRNELRILRHLHDVSDVATLVYAEVRLCACYFVFERIRGQPLHKHLQAHPEINKGWLVNQLLQAYSNIQRKNIVHRDIKFDNILVEYNEGVTTHHPFQIRVIDFGLSVYQSDLKRFEHSEVAGTYLFQCPEMYMGLPYNGSCDTWSFGTLVYMIFFGKAPYAVKRREVQQCHTFRMMPAQMQAIGTTLASIKVRALREWLQGILVLDRETRPLLLDVHAYRPSDDASEPTIKPPSNH